MDVFAQGGRRACGYEHIYLQANEFGDQVRKLLIVSFGPSIFDQDVVTLEVAEFTQPVTEWLHQVFLKRGGRVPQEAYSRDTPLLLRARGERPRGCAAEQRDELAPFHVWMAPAWQEITWRAAQKSLAVMCPASHDGFSVKG
jgi:hypothetical protein